MESVSGLDTRVQSCAQSNPFSFTGLERRGFPCRYEESVTFHTCLPETFPIRGKFMFLTVLMVRIVISTLKKNLPMIAKGKKKGNVWKKKGKEKGGRGRAVLSSSSVGDMNKGIGFGRVAKRVLVGSREKRGNLFVDSLLKISPPLGSIWTPTSSSFSRVDTSRYILACHPFLYAFVLVSKIRLAYLLH